MALFTERKAAQQGTGHVGTLLAQLCAQGKSFLRRLWSVAATPAVTVAAAAQARGTVIEAAQSATAAQPSTSHCAGRTPPPPHPR